MSNVSDRRMHSVSVKEGDNIFHIGALLKEAEANKSNPDFVSALDELQSMGQGKGLPFEFLDGEEITFDKFEECVIVVRHSELDGKKYPMLSVVADSNKRGKDLEIPLSIFRRVPILPEEREWLLKESPLNEKMIRNSLGDLARLMLVAGAKLVINEMKKCAKQAFETVNGKRVPVQLDTILALEPEKRKSFWCYRISVAK